MWLSNKISPWILVEDLFWSFSESVSFTHSSTMSVHSETDTNSCFLSCVPFRRSLMSSELYPMRTRMSSSSASAWSTPPHFTTSPRSGCQRSGLITLPHPSSSLGPSRTSYWTWTSLSTWTDLMSSQFSAPGHGAWRKRSGPQTTLSVRHSRKRTWRRHLMQPSLPPLRTNLARPRRGGFLTGAPKLSPDAAGRSSFASSELRLLTLWVVEKNINLFQFFTFTWWPICGSLASFPVKYVAYFALGCRVV